MKKTVNINLGGSQFVIDEDAYQLLTQYFDTLSNVYKDSEDSKEFISDIEARAAELMMMKMSSPQTIITIQIADEVIAQIGRPQDFEGVEITPDSVRMEETILPPPIPPQTEKVTKRLFRNPENKMLGGVCSGIAAYLGVDTTWIRLATVLLCFLSFSTAAVAYIILWIVIPEAKTPLERMQMNGQTPTFQNIGQQVSGMFKNEGNNQQITNNGTPPSGFAYYLSRACAMFAKGILILICIICAPVVVALLVAVMVLIVCLIISLMGLSELIIPAALPTDSFNLLLLTGIGSIVTIGIPLGILIWLITTGSRKTMAPGWKHSLIIAWIIAFAISAAGTLICKHNNVAEKWSKAIEKIQQHADETDETINVISDSIDNIGETIVENDSISVTSSEGKTISIHKDSIVMKKPSGKKSVIRK